MEYKGVRFAKPLFASHHPVKKSPLCDLQRIRKRGRQKACSEIAGVLMQLNKGGPGLLLIGIL